MKDIKVIYFASLREVLGKTEDTYQLNESLTVEALWMALNPSVELPSSTLVAINHEYSSLDAMLSKGDEVAFFPPVTGG
ncbi:MoaD/ThiS family protein [Leucothrix sargassi]|nr:MoaD/ThiS family protein [Leucothrix sargassi]